MKKRLILGLFIISLNVWPNDPDYNTTTGIVSFPRVRVNNSTPYINVQLLLNSEGSWSILEAKLEPESEFDLTGDWRGEKHDPGDFGVPLNALAITKISLIQIGNKLTGCGSFTPTCFSNETECLKMGGLLV